MSQELSSQRVPSAWDKTISAARSAWYATTEPPRLALARSRYLNEYIGPGALVSVYVPTHNRFSVLLGRSLKSILAQTYRDFEVIVAAHGCTDGTERYVRSLGDSRIRVLSIPREQTYPPTVENHWFAGPVVPANAALVQCRGTWIARNDDDDEWTEDHLRRLLSFAISGGYEFVSGGHEGPDGPVAPYDLDGVNVGGVQTWLYRSYLKFFKFNPDCWQKKIDRVNDTDLQARMRRAGVSMGYLNKTVAYVRPRPGEHYVGLQAYKIDEVNKLRELAF